VRENLQRAGLPDQRVYIVSNKTLRTYVKSQGKNSTTSETAWVDVIDEVELVHDVLGDAWRRRGKPNDESTEEVPISIASSLDIAVVL